MANSPNLHIFWTVGGNRSTRRKPTQTRGECANSTQTVRESGIETGSLVLLGSSVNHCATLPLNEPNRKIRCHSSSLPMSWATILGEAG